MTIVLQVVQPEGARRYEVRGTKALRIGRGTSQGIEIGTDNVVEPYARIALRGAALELKPIPGATVAVNGIPIAAATALHHGDEIEVARARVVILSWTDQAVPRAPLARYEEWTTFLAFLCERAARPIGVAAVSMGHLNAPAKAALHARLMTEVARVGVSAVWGELSDDVLCAAFCEVAPAALERLFALLPEVAGQRAAVALARAPDDGDDAHALVGKLWTTLSGDASDGAVVADAAMVRLYDLAPSLARAKGHLCVSGPPGSGRSTFLKRVAALAGESYSVFQRACGDVGGWQLVHDIQGTVAVPAHGRLLCTAAAPIEECAFNLVMPPLVARPADITAMAEAFLMRLRDLAHRHRLQLSAPARAALSAWHWPGNVEELKNAMYRAARVTVSDEVERDAVPADASRVGRSEGFATALQGAERQLLLDALARTRWNVTAAALRLSMPRRTMVARMARLGLKRPQG